MRLLIICGPTAAGKTDAALFLAKKYGGEVISADSRQVYEGLDIGTGKDLPSEVVRLVDEELGIFYETKDTKIWGYDIVYAKGEFSVSEYVKKVIPIILDVNSRGKLPILVGGTGLYIKGVVDGIQTSDVPRNISLRKSLKNKSATELFEILRVASPTKAASLNSSDKQNPRRLIRGIEVALSKSKNTKVTKYEGEKLFIGLTANLKELDERIEKRVAKRLNDGVLDEIKSLLDDGVNWKSQSMSSLGYRQWQQYFKNSSADSKGKAIEEWIREEKRYARRQIKWFKKDSRISWFDICQKDYLKYVEELVSKWYSQSSNA